LHLGLLQNQWQKCNSMHGIAKDVEETKIRKSIGKFRCFSGLPGVPHNLEVTGSNPVPATLNQVPL
jgi:hypothetical protein